MCVLVHLLCIRCQSTLDLPSYTPEQMRRETKYIAVFCANYFVRITLLEKNVK